LKQKRLQSKAYDFINAKFYQLIVSLSVVLLQLNMTKLKLEVLKSDYQRKEERCEHG